MFYETFYYSRSIAQFCLPKNHTFVSTCLCTKCGDSLSLDLHESQYSKMTDHVRSGCSPDDSEQLFYSKLSDDVLTTVDRYQSELYRLQDLSKAIKGKLELLRACMAGIDSIMSPIRRLPLELLGEIFKYVCCDDIGANRILLRDEKRLPTLTLSHVCSRWYNLVNSMPVLWSSFGTEDLGSSYNHSLFKLFLGRSGIHPIDFTIRANLYDPSPTSFCSLFVSKSYSRWRHVEIAAPEAFVREMLQSLMESGTSLPILVHLRLDSAIPDVMDFPLAFPNLQCLALDGVALEPKVPLLMVTHLNLNRLTPEETSRLISRCPNIQDIAINSFVSLSASVDPPMTSCNAQKLMIDLATGHFAAFTHSMVFPQLVHLELLNMCNSYETNNLERLCSMLQQSHCRLTHLQLHSISFAPEGILHLLSCVSLITNLVIEESIRFELFGIRLILKALIFTPPRQIQGDEQDQVEHASVIWPIEGAEADEYMHQREEEEEEEESIERREKELGIQVSEGQCFLPRLKDLSLVIRPRKKLLLELVRSRWKPSSSPETSSVETHPSDSACVSLQRLHLQYPGRVVESALDQLVALQESLEGFKNDGLDVEISMLSRSPE